MIDNTTRTITRQLKYLVSSTYEVGIYDRANDRMHLRSFTAGDIYKSVNFLKYKNMNGHDIFIRPEGESGYVFIDDLTVSDLSAMEKEGFKLAVALESSPMNYQGWLRVSDTALPTETASIVGRYLARKFGADMRSSDWRHFGRLAGFTNRKPGYVDELGKYPFVNIYSVSSKTYSESKMLVKEALIEHQERQEALKRFETPLKPLVGKDPSAVYLEVVGELRTYWMAKTGKYNSSDGDWNAVIKLLRLGFNQDQISQVLFDHSDSVAKRSNARANDYVRRTIINAQKLTTN